MATNKDSSVCADLLAGYEPRATIFDMVSQLARDAHGLDQRVYAHVFHEITKQTLWCIHELVTGQSFKVIDGGKPILDRYLPFRLSGKQRERVREACAIIFDAIMTKELEPTPIQGAKRDSSFQRFLQQTMAPRRQRESGRTRRGASK